MYTNWYNVNCGGRNNMKNPLLNYTMPIPVKRALGKLGQDIRDARKRRRISTQTMADRASISRVTLNKIENGESVVSVGAYAKALFVLGMSERLADLVDVTTDTLGLALEEERLPQRIRRSRINKSANVT
jgi:transcriptional regulator with XRE-family HTH domain